MFGSLKSHHVLALLGLLILIVALGQVSTRKSGYSEALTQAAHHPAPHPSHQPAGRPSQAVAVTNAADAGAAAPAHPAGQNSDYASVPAGGKPSASGLPPSCSPHATNKPEDLLPNDQNSEWARLNPRAGGNFGDVSLLKAGFHAGIYTVGGSLRNANLQVRSEPPNPTSVVSPWMNTTIEPDLMRVPLEIGCGPQ